MNQVLEALQLDAAWAGPLMTVSRIVLILIMAWVVMSVAKRLLGTIRSRLAARIEGDIDAIKRTETLTRVFRYVVTVVVSLVAGMLVLSELGISLAPILGAAGVVGLAVGFGAQSLVKDYFTGLFLLIENQIRQGDVVNIAGLAGAVEEINLRHIRLRDYEGNVHFVPNGMVTTVTNMTREFSQAVVDVGVAYREDVDEVFAVMNDTARELREDEAFSAHILGDLEMAGVNAWADSAVVIRARLRVAAGQQWGVRREYLRRLKKAFDQRGIEIPFPHMTVYAGQDKDGSSPAFRLEQSTAVAAAKAIAPSESSKG